MKFAISLEQKSFILSVIFHLCVFASSFISVLRERPANMLLMDIEFAGEGELREMLEKQEAPLEEPKIPQEEKKPEPEKEPEKEEKPPENVEQKPEQEQTTQTKSEAAEEESQKPNAEPQDAEVEKAEEVEKIEEEPSEPEEENSTEEPSAPPKIEKPKRKKAKKSLKSIVKKADKQKKLSDVARKASAKKKADDNFKKMMRDSIDKLPSSKRSSGKGARGSGVGAFGAGGGLSESDYEVVRSQIYPYWIVPAGVKDAENIIIAIRVKLRDNGEVADIKILDENRYNADYVFRAVADSARRAVLEASPLSIPKGKMNLFREFVFSFNLKETLGE